MTCSPLREAAEQPPQGSGRQRPSFSVPRLRRGVHRPAATALRAGPGVVGGGLLGRAPAAAVAGRPVLWWG